MNAQTGFWFPSMKIGEIVRALEEWGLRVSDDQIQKPTGDIVQAIYVLFVQQVTGITPEALEQPVNRAIAVIEEHPELYTNSLNLNLVLHHVQRLAHAARVQDLSMRDLILPEPERTRNILSAIINFIKFAEERGSFLKKLRDQSTSALAERERMEQSVTELKQKIAEVKKQREADEPRCRALREENAQIGKVIIAIQNAKAEVSKEVDARKKDKSILSRQRENIVRDIELVTTSINSTRSRIVQSPDRIKKHISEMGLMAQDERMIIAAADAKSRELKIKLDALNVFEQDMKKLIDDLRMIQSESIQVDNIQHKLTTFRDELDRKLIMREQLLGRADRAKRQMRNAEDKLVRAQQHAEDRRGKSEEEIARLKRDYEEMSEERRENDKQVEETKQDANELERKVRPVLINCLFASLMFATDARALKEERDRIKRASDRILELATPDSYLSRRSAFDVRNDEDVSSATPRWGDMRGDSKWKANNSMIAGAGGGLVASVATCPLDVVKTKLQAQRARHGDTAYKGVLSTVKHIVKIDGLRGLYRGLGPTILGYLPTWAIYFAVYDGIKTRFGESPLGSTSSTPKESHASSIYPAAQAKGYQPTIREHPWSLHILSAMTAGATSTICTNPLWVIKTRFMTQPSHEGRYRNTLDAFLTIYRTEGFSAFYRGLFPSLLGITHVAVQFPLYEKLKFWAQSDSSIPLTNSQILGCSGVAKMCASLATYPHEVVRTRLQTQRRLLASSANKLPPTSAARGAGDAAASPAAAKGQQVRHDGLIHTTKKIVRKEGWRGLYKGLSVNLVRTVPNSAVTMLTYELLMRHLSSRGES
ncbi:hypothetical protein EW145_g515 [Phellinidium pouzarii]|uniref:Uncharacterized protein n=1 Tax=Phellinidium pouzarii TaxID=167371 RepID=A0A4S4LI14_9AGAM|nr:hypothetical protein EW145_g515 [Phellinidium pouzarii]